MVKIHRNDGFYRATHVHSAVYAMAWCTSQAGIVWIKLVFGTEAMPSACYILY